MAAIKVQALRGIQNGKTKYTAQIKFSELKPFFEITSADMSPEERTQRLPSEARCKKIGRYLEGKTWIIPGILAACEEDLEFNPLMGEYGELTIPIGQKLLITDGQHRILGIDYSIKELENGCIENDTLTVEIFPGCSKKDMRTFFCDVNSKGTPVSNNLVTLYDTRSVLSDIVRDVVKQKKEFRAIVELEAKSLNRKSSKYFTLTGVSKAFLNIWDEVREIADVNGGLEKMGAAERAKLTKIYKGLISSYLEATGCLEGDAKEMRSQHLATSQATLEAAMRAMVGPMAQNVIVENLKKIDWDRDNPAWDGLILFDGKISKNQKTIGRMKEYIENFES